MRSGIDIVLVVQEGEVRRPVPPPRLSGLGEWEKLYAVERAAGVVEFSGVIQVSVRARSWRSLL